MLEPVERALREALAGEPCFIRRSRTDDALWICDLPRRLRDNDVLSRSASNTCEPSNVTPAPNMPAHTALAQISRRLNTLNVSASLDPHSGLWLMDLTPQGYAAILRDLPPQPPPLPADDELHPAYALCRLLLKHPSPLEAQPLAPLRAVLKRADGSRRAMLQIIQPAHMLCAELLRRGEPLPHGAGTALAQWLINEEEPL